MAQRGGVWLDVDPKPKPGDWDYEAPRKRRGRAVVSRPGVVHEAARPTLNARQVQAQIHVVGQHSPARPYRADEDDYSLWKTARVKTPPPDDDEMGEYGDRDWWDGSGAAPAGNWAAAASATAAVHPVFRDPDEPGAVGMSHGGSDRQYITITADSPVKPRDIGKMLFPQYMEMSTSQKQIADLNKTQLVPVIRAAILFMQEQRSKGTFYKPIDKAQQTALDKLLEWGVAKVAAPAIRSSSLGVSARVKYSIKTPLYVKMRGHFAQLTAYKGDAVYRTVRA